MFAVYGMKLVGLCSTTLKQFHIVGYFWMQTLTKHTYCIPLYHSIIYSNDSKFRGSVESQQYCAKVQHPDSERGSALRANPGFLEITNLATISGRIRIFVFVGGRC